MTIKSFLKSIENKYSDSEYVNVVGTKSDMKVFIENCKKNDIWFYRVCPFCVYKMIRFQIVFLKKSDINAIKKLIENKDLVLNASNPF